MSSLMLFVYLALAPGGIDTVRPISQSDAVIAVYTEDHGLDSDGDRRLILAAWADGHVVWSEARIRGGPPYFSGQVAPSRVVTALNRAEQDGAFGDSRLGQPCFGPDSRFTTILFRKGKLEVRMDSWHEQAEAQGRLIASSCALTSLSSRRRLEVLKKEPAEYLYYRVVWGELRAAGSSLIPTTGRPVKGEVLMRAGVMKWQEAEAK